MKGITATSILEVKTDGKTEQVEAPIMFMEEVRASKPAVFETAITAYQHFVRNTDREEQPLKFLTCQRSYAFRVFSLIPTKGSITLKVKASPTANTYHEIPNATQATFGKIYGQVVSALYKAQKAGVAVCKATTLEGANGTRVQIKAVGGIIGIDRPQPKPAKQGKGKTTKGKKAPSVKQASAQPASAQPASAQV